MPDLPLDLVLISAGHLYDLDVEWDDDLQIRRISEWSKIDSVPPTVIRQHISEYRKWSSDARARLTEPDDTKILNVPIPFCNFDSIGFLRTHEGVRMVFRFDRERLAQLIERFPWAKDRFCSAATSFCTLGLPDNDGFGVRLLSTLSFGQSDDVKMILFSSCPKRITDGGRNVDAVW